MEAETAPVRPNIPPYRTETTILHAEHLVGLAHPVWGETGVAGGLAGCNELLYVELHCGAGRETRAHVGVPTAPIGILPEDLRCVVGDDHKYVVVGEPETERIGLPDEPVDGRVTCRLVEPVALLEKHLGNRHMIGGLAAVELGPVLLELEAQLLRSDERHELGADRLLRGERTMRTDLHGNGHIAFPAGLVVVPRFSEGARTCCEIGILLGGNRHRNRRTSDFANLLAADLGGRGNLDRVDGYPDPVVGQRQAVLVVGAQILFPRQVVGIPDRPEPVQVTFDFLEAPVRAVPDCELTYFLWAADLVPKLVDERRRDRETEVAAP